ncbi:MAG TPA: hypothetical protein VFV34_13975, partial [Blastocatellia bacterium]|nr:hypothetical protein [Blastocatellia bacterium]
MGTDELEARRGVYFGVFFTSLSVLSLELVLTRIFSVTMYYHFAFMAISLALFGSGVSGVYVFLGSRRFSPERAPRQMAVCSLLMALSVLVSLVALLRVSVGLLASFRTYLILAGLYAICAVPFFFGGVVLSLAMKHLAKKSGRLYFFDLVGAAAGCLLVIPAINALGGPGTMLGVSVVCAAAAFSFASLLPQPRRLTSASVATGLLFIVLISANGRWDWFTVVWAKGSREKAMTFAKWNSFSRVTVSGDINDSKPLWITIDSDAGTPILRYSNNPDAMQYVERAVSALAYQIKTEPKVLVIGPGGGREVVTAIESGSTDITGVEVNPLIVRDVMQTEPYRSFSGSLYNRPEVNAVVDEGRAYIRGSNARFDIIQASLIDTWAANSAGAFALSENNLYTVEAFKLYLDHLTPDGVLTMTRWLLDPPQQELRLVSLARETMRQLGVERPENHLCLFKAPGKGERIETCFVFKKSEFTPDEVAKLEQVAAQNKCEVLYTPATRPQNVFTELVTAANPDVFYERYPINVRPTFDNSPFFFYHVRAAELLRALSLTNESRKTNMGVFVLFALLVITSIFVGALMLAPLAVARRRMSDVAAETGLNEIVYFAFLGLGFIVIEMAMIQRFILFLGYPVYALAVV